MDIFTLILVLNLILNSPSEQPSQAQIEQVHRLVDTIQNDSRFYPSKNDSKNSLKSKKADRSIKKEKTQSEVILEQKPKSNNKEKEIRCRYRCPVSA